MTVNADEEGDRNTAAFQLLAKEINGTASASSGTSGSSGSSGSTSTGSTGGGGTSASSACGSTSTTGGGGGYFACDNGASQLSAAWFPACWFRNPCCRARALKCCFHTLALVVAFPQLMACVLRCASSVTEPAGWRDFDRQIDK